ncbi:16S rRNA (uracil(1498)-N(3))-methyltransferase [Sporomusa sp. KB1]|jgi:16S rRNA (uracil1498-N3)-methyltransferase|uniref:16S rRNA (uracil(1498)-N(3))-methyltransferase n=1 Tax=Sporomusa sp. KB1 TaxID=943346 RepID=UPI0011A338D1|nr:16S rRNA (uracil(1498)-N(3))-methyltransferase [Sporomusa sp. KB1]TWH48760.1 16S rRNA (uracil1498-N3)-methyltransferase [Sporomusa sp. KB1]
MRRFFIDAPLSEHMVIANADARHIASVLRLSAGATVLVSDRDGKSGKAEIIAANPEAIELRLLEFLEDTTESPINIWLVQSLAKGEKMDFIIQKAVELGVYGIIPVATAHSVVRYDAAKQVDKVARWQKIAREAAKQCGRSCIPQVCQVTSLAQVLENNEFAAANKIMLYEGQAAQGIKQALTDSSSQTYVLFIGPEGGFSSAEVDLCQEHGIRIVTMGPRIMRTETAALAAISAVMYECGDLGG